MFLMRDYAKGIRRVVPFLALEALEDEDLSNFLGSLLKEAISATGYPHAPSRAEPRKIRRWNRPAPEP